ncbi:hypothetical protein QE152_g38510 [Popillia japonica]|uniref:Uncharacterized protein n=1 Tax=Popillia japonica TaxID=7064 RepID=A0AAW1HWM3_POPJA
MVITTKPVRPLPTAVFLGIAMDGNMKWNQHIESLAKKLSYALFGVFPGISGLPGSQALQCFTTRAEQSPINLLCFQGSVDYREVKLYNALPQELNNLPLTCFKQKGKALLLNEEQYTIEEFLTP